MKRTIAGLAGAVLALGTANAYAQSADTDNTQEKQPQATQRGAGSETAAQNQQALPVAGVVSKVDKQSNRLTIVLPATTQVDVTKYGKTLMTEKNANLVSLQAPLSQGAPVMRDGKNAKLNDLKEGDIVRAAFDHNTMKFDGVTAVSQSQIDKDLKEAQKELKSDVKTMEKSGKQMNQ